MCRKFSPGLRGALATRQEARQLFLARKQTAKILSLAGACQILFAQHRLQITREALAQKLKGMGLDEVLIVTDSVDENLLLSSRNLPHVLVVEPRNADPVSLLRFEKTLITRGAVAKMQEMLV